MPSSPRPASDAARDRGRPKHLNRRVLLAAACVGAAWVMAPAGVAGAATCGASRSAAPGALAAIDGRERLAWIDRRLGEEAIPARRWAGWWSIGIGAAGLASLAPVPFVARGDRVDWYTGAVSAGIGVLPFLIAPPAVIGDARKLHRAIETAGWLDDAAVCALLVDAEGKLAADAADERWQRGWWIHAGNVVFNTGVALFLGLGFHHWTSGIINGVSGAIVGETIVLTQPTGAIDDLAAYGRADLSAGARPLGLSYGARF